MYGGTADRQPYERSGRHPRDARRPGRQEGTQQLRADTSSSTDRTGLLPLNLDNTELETIAEEPSSPVQEAEAGASSSGPPRTAPVIRRARVKIEPRVPQAEEADREEYDEREDPGNPRLHVQGPKG